MTADDVRSLIRALFLKGDPTFPLADDTDLLAEGICDSLGLVTLASALEERVPRLRVADQDVTRERLGSVGAILVFLREHAP